MGAFDNEVIATAMAGYDGHRGSVYYLAVSRAYQRRGFGQQLMSEIERQLLAAGCPKVNLMVRAGNNDVVDFYRRLGYGVEEVVALGHRLIPDHSVTD